MDEDQIFKMFNWVGAKVRLKDPKFSMTYKFSVQIYENLFDNSQLTNQNDQKKTKKTKRDPAILNTDFFITEACSFFFSR